MAKMFFLVGAGLVLVSCSSLDQKSPKLLYSVDSFTGSSTFRTIHNETGNSTPWGGFVLDVQDSKDEKKASHLSLEMKLHLYKFINVQPGESLMVKTPTKLLKFSSRNGSINRREQSSLFEDRFEEVTYDGVSLADLTEMGRPDTEITFRVTGANGFAEGFLKPQNRSAIRAFLRNLESPEKFLVDKGSQAESEKIASE